MNRIGVILFLVAFAILVRATLSNPTLPFGQQIYHAVGGVDVDYPILGIPATTLVPATFNGIVYGFMVWLLYTIVSSPTGRIKKAGQTIQAS